MYQARIQHLYDCMRTYSQTMPDNALTLAVAAELQQLRKAQGITQGALAEASGIPRVSIQRYENGGSIKIEELGILCDALGEDPAALFARAVARVHRED